MAPSIRRPGIDRNAGVGRTFKASQGRDAPRGRTASGAPRAMNRPPK